MNARTSLALAACLPLLIAACGGGSSSGSSATTATPAAPATPATPAAPANPGVAEYLSLDLANPMNYARPALPAHYDAAVLAQANTPPGDPASDRLATLGRVLFFDRRLSVNDTVSCATCHRPELGFTDAARFSAGFSGTQFTTAHAMRLGNAVFYRPGTMFWDKRATSLEDQATQPIHNAVEMGFDASNGGATALLTKMRALPYYPELFAWAFGDATITEARLSRAIAHFERAMISAQSRFDAAYAQVYDPAAPNQGLNAPFPAFTAQENRGKQLFLTPPPAGGAGCNACHAAPTFALTPNSLSNGLDAGETRIFKSPSLKNVAAGGPYMHDGRFTTLDAVIDHYDHGIQDGPALDNRLRANRVLNLSAADKAALVAFLRTLDDPALGADVRFSTPFVK